MAGQSYRRPIVPPYCIEDCRILQVDTCKKGHPYMTSPTFRGKGSKIEAKLLVVKKVNQGGGICQKIRKI